MTQDASQPVDDWPVIRTVGFDGFLVSFSDHLSEGANRAALAFRNALEGESWSGVEETSTSLVSTYLRFDPLSQSHAQMRARLMSLLETQDWFEAPLHSGRKLWHVPTVYGTDMAPQLEEAAQLAGMTAEEAIASVSQTRVRVLTIGFAPGQPYLGELAKAWDIPRQTELTKAVPEGALTIAIRQLVLFSVSAPTGWRHIGQTALRLFHPEAEDPFVLRPGDEVLFEPTSPDALSAMRKEDRNGGATYEVLT